MEKSPIRVLQVFTIMDRGGAESMIMNYYRHIDRTKVQFDFLVHREGRGAYEDEIIKLGGKVYRMPSINPFFPYNYYKALDEFLKYQSYRIIHSHLNTFSSFPLKIARKNNIQCRIAHAHIALQKVNIWKIFSTKNERDDEIKKIVKSILKIKVTKHATDLFSCGYKAGKWLFDEKSFTLIENAIDTSLYVPNELKNYEIRTKLGLGNKLVIGHVGRFSEQKNHMFILSVFKSIVDKNKNSSLILVGDGELRTMIEDEAKRLKIFNDVRFLGVRSDVPDILQVLDVFLFPSYYEGLPVTLVEAQAAGLKIFASNTITDEVAFTDDISFLSIDDSAVIWADEILDSIPYLKKDNCTIIKAKGYDVAENAKQLESFYLEQL